MHRKHFAEAVATLIGATIGAGILAIPYVISKSGFLGGLINLILIGIAIIMTNLLLGEIVLRTEGNHQLTGYAEKYLGKNGRYLMFIASAIGFYGAMIAYTIGVGQALSNIFPSIPAFWLSIIFFFFAMSIVYLGIKLFERYELIVSSLVVFIAILISILILSSGKFHIQRTLIFDATKIYLPYSVVLFAYLGTASIPEMKEELGRYKNLLKKAIIFGGLVPMFIYTLFAFVVIGSNDFVSPLATTHIGELFGSNMNLIVNLFAVFAMSTSFVVLAFALRETYYCDYGMKREYAWILTGIVPFFIFLLGVVNFVEIISITGALTGGIMGILIIMMHYRAKKRSDRKPEYSIKSNILLYAILLAMFILGIFFELFSFGLIGK